MSSLETQELKNVMKGLARFEGMDAPTIKQGETYVVDVTTLGLFKIKGYEMHMERIDKEALEWQSREHGGGANRWDHHMSVVQDGALAIWTDDVMVEAGLATGIFARYCRYMYRRRHKIRQALSITSRIERV